MKLHATPNSTYCRRVRIALHEKGLEVELVDMPKPERETPAFRALNPWGRIPVLVDGELVLCESTAILQYLEELHPDPPLVPPDPAGRALVAMHVKLCDLEFTPHVVGIMGPKRFQARETWDLERMARLRDPIAAHYAILEHRLAGGDWLVADRFTHADLAYLPFLHFHELLEVDLPPRVMAWWERMSRRPSARATEPEI